MVKKYTPEYPLVWQKDDLFIEIFCSIPNIATGIILTTDTATFIIDPGDGILRDLNKEIGPEQILRISDIFISHGHHDHVGGLWSLFTYLNVMRRKEPLYIHYPKGCSELKSIHKAFLDVYSRELSYDIKLVEIVNPKRFTKNKVTITPFHVNHSELAPDGKSAIRVPSLGFKFSYNKKTICYGGDTAYCDSLVKMAKGCDLAVIEAGADSEESSDLHLTREEADRIGSSAKEFFLVHIPE